MADRISFIVICGWSHRELHRSRSRPGTGSANLWGRSLHIYSQQVRVPKIAPKGSKNGRCRLLLPGRGGSFPPSPSSPSFALFRPLSPSSSICRRNNNHIFAVNEAFANQICHESNEGYKTLTILFKSTTVSKVTRFVPKQKIKVKS
jgi:hypothetical protein